MTLAELIADAEARHLDRMRAAWITGSPVHRREAARLGRWLAYLRGGR